MSSHKPSPKRATAGRVSSPSRSLRMSFRSLGVDSDSEPESKNSPRARKRAPVQPRKPQPRAFKRISKDLEDEQHNFINDIRVEGQRSLRITRKDKMKIAELGEELRKRTRLVAKVNESWSSKNMGGFEGKVSERKRKIDHSEEEEGYSSSGSIKGSRTVLVPTSVVRSRRNLNSEELLGEAR